MSVYYNEIDEFCAAWLCELMKAGQIPDGEVDTRSIELVQPDDVRGFRQCHFFAGIGGWAYALRLAGWPDEREVWTGSCPCQPWSIAGKGARDGDSRDLWPAWFRLWRQCRPSVGFGEQVASGDGLAWWDRAASDLEAENYAVAPFDLCAASVGAVHIRQRLYFVATDTDCTRLPKRANDDRYDRYEVPSLAWCQFERTHAKGAWARWDAESGVRLFAHGVPNVGGRLRGFGNAIVPQVAKVFIEAFLDCCP